MNIRLKHLAIAATLSASLLAGCDSQGSTVNCDLDRCTVTFERGVEAQASVLGVQAKLVSVNGDQVTIEVAGQQATLTAGQAATDVGGLSASLDKVTDSQVIVKISR